MVKLRTAMDAAFWDLNVSSPQALDGISKAVPGEHIPSDGTRANGTFRVQQLALLRDNFHLGIIPSYSPSANHKELGSFALQSLLHKAASRNWWVGFIGQFRPKKLITSIDAEIRGADKLGLPLIKDVAKHFLDKSLYAAGLCSQIVLTSPLSLQFSAEKHGERKGFRTRAMLLYEHPNVDLTLEAAWPELFIDHKGKYWEVPLSISSSCLSIASESGLRYRLGIHGSGGIPQAIDSSDSMPPLPLMPGMCLKGALSYEKNKDLWRQKETKDDITVEKKQGQIPRCSYDIRLREPHAALSGIIGITFTSWFGGKKNFLAVDSTSAKSTSRFERDLFGSACYTYQYGKFKMLFGDLTRIDARLDISSALTLAKKVSNLFGSTSNNSAPNIPSTVGLNLTFQQQVVGPVVFRVDSKLSLDSSSGRHGPQLEDLVCSLNYSVKLLRSAKVVAWYSPKRKEGMIELRLIEF